MKLLNLLQSNDKLMIATFLLSHGMCEDEWTEYIRSTDSKVNGGFWEMLHILDKLENITSVDMFFEKWYAPLNSVSGAIVLNIDNHREIPYVYENLKSGEYAKYRANCEKLEAVPIKTTDAVLCFRKFMSLVATVMPQESHTYIATHSLDMSYDELLNESKYNTDQVFASFCCALSHQLWLLENQEI